MRDKIKITKALLKNYLVQELRSKIETDFFNKMRFLEQKNKEEDEEYEKQS